MIHFVIVLSLGCVNVTTGCNTSECEWVGRVFGQDKMCFFEMERVYVGKRKLSKKIYEKLLVSWRDWCDDDRRDGKMKPFRVENCRSRAFFSRASVIISEGFLHSRESFLWRHGSTLRSMLTLRKENFTITEKETSYKRRTKFRRYKWLSFLISSRHESFCHVKRRSF